MVPASVEADMLSHAERRSIAHAALCLLEPPYLKHYRNGRFKSWKGVSLVASDLPGPGFNFAAVLQPEAPSLDELLPVARDFFAASKQGWGVLVEGDAGHAMEAELRAREWAIAEDEPAFVLDDTAACLLQNIPGLAIRAGDVAAYHRVTGEAFQSPPELAELFTPAPGFARDPDIAVFVGSVEGTDVTAAGYSRSGDTAVLWGVATLEAYRGRGYGSAVSRAAVAHALENGCTTAALRSGTKSMPVYERLGFRYVCQHRTYAAPA